MKRNYNGKLNRSHIREFKKLCAVQAENTNILMDMLAKNGKAYVYTNLGFFGEPDELSDTVEISTKAEAQEFLKKDFEARIQSFLNVRKPDEDYLLSSIISFTKASGGVFPDVEEMKQLEKDAEAQRLSNVTEEAADNLDAYHLLLKEILELSEEIIELRREKNPKDIWVHVEPYNDEMSFRKEDELEGKITWDRYNSRGDCRDYKLQIWDWTYGDRTFYYMNDYTPAVNWQYDDDNERRPKLVKKHLIDIHKKLSDIAKKEGFEFTTEVDYTQINYTPVW